MPGASKFLDFMRDLRSSAEILAGPCLEIEHLALPERKFEQYLNFFGAQLSVTVSSSLSQLDSLSAIQSSISFGTAIGMLS